MDIGNIDSEILEMPPSKVLVVDDIEQNTFAMKLILSKLENIEVLAASSGAKALELMLHHDFAVILLDVQMPEMDGYETAEFIRGSEKSKHTPIIFVTAINREEKHIFKGYESGAVDYLLKPIEPEILSSKVRVFVDLYQWRQSLQVALEKIEKAHEQVKESEEKFKNIFKESPAAILVTDQNHQLTSWNPHAEKFLDCSPKDLESMNFSSFFGFREWEKVSTWTDNKESNECKMITKNGSESDVRISVNLIHNTKSGQADFIYVISDLTELKTLERLKDNLINTVSHELRTPMAILKASIYNLKGGFIGDLSPTQSKVISKAEDSLLRLSVLVENLLDISDFENYELVLELQEKKLSSVLEPIIQKYNKLAQEQIISFKYVADNDSGTGSEAISGTINVDSKKIEKCLEQILDNAFRYAEKEILFSLQKFVKDERIWTRFSVQDDGPGIPKNRQDELFKSFSQINRGQGGAGYKGMGLGLVISQKIVEAHRGKIWIESDDKKGTTVFFEIPN